MNILFNNQNIDIADFISINEDWLKGIHENPITAIEGATLKVGSKIRGACICNCIGCSANALIPDSRTYYLTPTTLKGILNYLKELTSFGYHLLSKERINLFSGSNELDQPYCIELRNELSKFYSEVYNIQLGAVSSDLVFHISRTNIFKDNLDSILEEPHLFDNICMSIDEQIPFTNKADYQNYLEELRWVWMKLEPIIKNELPHINSIKSQNSRLIINVLLPNEGNSYKDKHKYLYEGGPSRALKVDELLERYVKPFVGEILPLNIKVPSHHVFTSEIASLSGVKNSRVFISKSNFEPIGRAKSLCQNKYEFPPVSLDPCIRTKILPINDKEFLIQAVLAPSIYSDGTFIWREKPEWVEKLKSINYSVTHNTIKVAT